MIHEFLKYEHLFFIINMLRGCQLLQCDKPSAKCQLYILVTKNFLIHLHCKNIILYIESTTCYCKFIFNTCNTSLEELWPQKAHGCDTLYTPAL